MYINTFVAFRCMCVLLLSFISATCSAQARRTALAEDWTVDDSMLLYFEAITHIRQKGLQVLTSRDIVQRTLQSYLRSLDPSSEYLTPEEYAQYKNTQQPHYEGVGMDIQRVASGRIMCTPYPGGPAAHAGIMAGDILEAVDGHRIAEQSILAVSAQVRGKKGTQVRLTIATRSGTSRDITIRRAAVRVESVLMEQGGPLPIIQLLTFSKETLQDLQTALEQFDTRSALIIDLRGNPGGSLYSAIDAAKLFLTPNQQVVGLQTRSGIKVYRKEALTRPIAVRLYLWQDEYMASAAEVFIAALTQNQRAVSIGKKTFGKGTVQDIIELRDGSALYLTTGNLLTPNGMLYHQKGLDPIYPIEMDTAKTEDYISKVISLLR